MSELPIIPFIYNYCDRWCERCAFTDRCDIAQEEKLLTDEQKDMTNPAFWKNITDNFQKTIDLIIQNTAQITFDEQPEEEEEEQFPQVTDPEEKAKIEVQIEGLTNLTRVYLAQVKHWYQSNDLLLTIEKEQNPVLTEALRVIEWYKSVIASKMHRATSHFFDPLSIQTDPIQNDRNGCAKLVLIFVENSLNAWESVRTIFPKMTDDLIDIFLILTHIRRDIQTLFPDAQKFKRPGFDDLE